VEAADVRLFVIVMCFIFLADSGLCMAKASGWRSEPLSETTYYFVVLMDIGIAVWGFWTLFHS
jgi:hypothetical protein